MTKSITRKHTKPKNLLAADAWDIGNVLLIPEVIEIYFIGHANKASSTSTRFDISDVLLDFTLVRFGIEDPYLHSTLT
jgi:hypothetical protein